MTGTTATTALEPARGLLLFLLGSCFGSFLNVCITRLPAGESVLAPVSHCRTCKGRLPLRAMVPLASYILLRARCIHCAAPISPRYFLVELCAGALTLATYGRFGPGPPFIARLSFAGALLAAAVIDFETGIIPDAISVYGTAWGFVLSWCAPAFSIEPWPSPLSSFLGALFGAGVLLSAARGYHAVTGREGLGGGDVKLLAMIGSFVGWERVPDILLLSALTGTLWGIALIALRRDVSLTTPLPFAPFLCLGTLLHMS